MSSFIATLVVEKNTYTLKHCSFDFEQTVQIDGSPHSEVVAGIITVVLEKPADPFLIGWMFNPTQKKAGSILFTEVNDMSGSFQELVFTNGFCVHLSNDFNGSNVASGELISKLTLSVRIESLANVPLYKK